MENYEEQLRLQPSDHSKAVWAVVAVWQTTTDGFNLNSETPTTNDTQCIAVIITTNVFAVY